MRRRRRPMGTEAWTPRGAAASGASTCRAASTPEGIARSAAAYHRACWMRGAKSVPARCGSGAEGRHGHIGRLGATSAFGTPARASTPASRTGWRRGRRGGSLPRPSPSRAVDGDAQRLPSFARTAGGTRSSSHRRTSGMPSRRPGPTGRHQSAAASSRAHGGQERRCTDPLRCHSSPTAHSWLHTARASRAASRAPARRSYRG